MTTWHHALLLMFALGSHASAAIAEPQVSVDTFIQASDNPGNAPQQPPATVHAPAPRTPSDSVWDKPLEVVVIADVASTGHVADVSVVTSSRQREIDRAAIEAVRQWQFEPTHFDGEAVPVRGRVRARFSRP